MNHINEHVFKVSTTSTNTRSQMEKPLVNRSVSDVLVKVKPSLHQAFSQVVDVMNLCFIHALLYNTLLSKFKAYDDSGPLWWSYDTYDAISLVISCCNITFSVFWLSQGSVATINRRGRWRPYRHMRRSFINLTVITALKSVDFWRSYRKK